MKHNIFSWTEKEGGSIRGGAYIRGNTVLLFEAPVTQRIVVFGSFGTMPNKPIYHDLSVVHNFR